MIRVTITKAVGSTPRDAGTTMEVWPGHIEGTIGGGALEWQAIDIARRMLREGRTNHQQTFPLGPSLGQCCGGSVTLAFSPTASDDTQTKQAVWIWGAGHVGRALVSVMQPLPGFALTWVDTSAERFPDSLPDRVAPLVATDMPRVVTHAPKNAGHLILTYSHEIDLRLCDALLHHGFDSCGLIGSATKWARFKTRLAALDHSSAQITRIACPIGDPNLGKHPQAIAVGVAAVLLSRLDEKEVRGDKTG